MDDYRIVAAIVDLGSFSAAAKALALTQPTISRRIEIIEKDAGAPLFHRHGRTLKVTPTGRLFYKKARIINRVVTQARREIQEHTGLRRRTISIAAHESYGVYVLPKLLSSFKRNHPQINFELHLQPEIELSFEDGYDFYLQDGSLRNSSLKSRKLGIVELNIYAAPNLIRQYRLENGIADSRRDIPWLQLDTYYIPLLKKKMSSDLISIMENNPLRCNNLNTLIHFAEEGFGVIPLADYIAMPSVISGQLCKVNTGWPPFSTALHLLFQPGIDSKSLTSVFKQHLIEGIAEILSDTSK